MTESLVSAPGTAITSTVNPPSEKLYRSSTKISATGASAAAHGMEKPDDILAFDVVRESLGYAPLQPIGFAAIGAEAAHEPLREYPGQYRAQQERLDLHIEEP